MTDTTPRALRQFGLTVGAAFLVLASLAAWRGRIPAASVTGAAGALLLAFAIVAPSRLHAVHTRWMALAHAMSRVTTPLFMGIVYFGIVTPLGLALRIVRRRGLSPPRSTDSFLVRRPTDHRRSDLRRQF